jgi:hypothetical protein
MRDLFPTELVTKVKPNINSVKVHPQLCNNRHPVDGVLVSAGSLWPPPPPHSALGTVSKPFDNAVCMFVISQILYQLEQKDIEFRITFISGNLNSN